MVHGRRPRRSPPNRTRLLPLGQQRVQEDPRGPGACPAHRRYRLCFVSHFRPPGTPAHRHQPRSEPPSPAPGPRPTAHELASFRTFVHQALPPTITGYARSRPPRPLAPGLWPPNWLRFALSSTRHSCPPSPVPPGAALQAPGPGPRIGFVSHFRPPGTPAHRHRPRPELPSPAPGPGLWPPNWLRFALSSTRHSCPPSPAPPGASLPGPWPLASGPELASFRTFVHQALLPTVTRPARSRPPRPPAPGLWPPNRLRFAYSSTRHSCPPSPVPPGAALPGPRPLASGPRIGFVSHIRPPGTPAHRHRPRPELPSPAPRPPAAELAPRQFPAPTCGRPREPLVFTTPPSRFTSAPPSH